MTITAQLAAEVRRAVADTPYTVIDEMPDGFTVRIDVVDRKWWTLMYRKSLRSTFRHEVKVDEAAGTYSVTDRSDTVSWQAGVDVGGGVPRPTLKASRSFTSGNVVTKSFRKEYGFDDDGSYGAVVDYTFSSSEGRQYVELAAQRLGLTKRMNANAKVGLVVGLGVGLVLAVGALVTAVVLIAIAVLG